MVFPLQIAETNAFISQITSIPTEPTRVGCHFTLMRSPWVVMVLMVMVVMMLIVLMMVTFQMLIEEEDPSLLNAFRQSNQIAVEVNCDDDRSCFEAFAFCQTDKPGEV